MIFQMKIKLWENFNFDFGISAFALSCIDSASLSVLNFITWTVKNSIHSRSCIDSKCLSRTLGRPQHYLYIDQMRYQSH